MAVGWELSKLIRYEKKKEEQDQCKSGGTDSFFPLPDDFVHSSSAASNLHS